MKLQKAIENLHFLSTSGAPSLRLDDITAIKLGIEALQLYKALKATGGVPKNFSGIGETP